MRKNLLPTFLFLACFGVLNPLFAEMSPVKGPATGNLGKIAQIKVPEGYSLFEKKDLKEFMEVTHNFYSDQDLGVLVNPDKTSGFMAFFSFDEVGYIKDAANEKLDADKMWKDMVENNALGNKERKKKGWEEMEMVRWEKQPGYNPETQRLEWASWLKQKNGEFMNYNTRVLGRKGVMRITLVPYSDQLQTVLPGFNQALGGFEFVTGNRYAEWTTGDKVADFGLAALVVGGAGALAAKTGLLAKFWKLIVFGFIALAGFFKKLFFSLFGKKDEDGPSSPPAP